MGLSRVICQNVVDLARLFSIRFHVNLRKYIFSELLILVESELSWDMNSLTPLMTKVSKSLSVLNNIYFHETSKELLKQQLSHTFPSKVGNMTRMETCAPGGRTLLWRLSRSRPSVWWSSMEITASTRSL